MNDYSEGSLVARVRLEPDDDQDRVDLGLCLGSGKPPIAGSETVSETAKDLGECGGCGALLPLERGLTPHHPA